MLPVITSLSNERIKRAAKLRNGADRRREGLFLVDGKREIRRALAGGVKVVEAYVSVEKLSEFRDILDRFDAENIPYWPLAPNVFEKLRFGERVEGLIIMAGSHERKIDSLSLPECPLIAVLEGVEKPGNLGAILRSADGAGVDAVIIDSLQTDIYNPNTIRGSLGTVFHLPIAKAENPVPWLVSRGIKIAAARCDGSIPYTEFDFTRPCAIVLGSEADGLSDAWSGPEVQAIRLPMLGIADSLNVSVAAAILFYHARMQRG